MRRTGNKARAAAALALATWCALATATASAERADRDKPVNIESDSLIADEAKKVAAFEGKVVLTQGSLIIRADRIVVQQDNDGFQRGVATGNPARFRHKREGLGEYIDGEALRIEYDTGADRVEFFKGARLRRDSGDDIRGDYISYDARTERFTVKASNEASGSGREGRVRATIMPKKPAPQTPASPGTGRQD
ncbi:MAG TPA: lipopolysaccharide transport periplasmic protein LptA [Burkholderiales bacterium]|nr:lipopolysaccharide transport periplasmic protein LptA [Burkholderiales bacterium]